MSSMVNKEDQIQQQIIEEDEIDLKELFATIFKYKFKIVLFTIFVVSLTLLYVLSIPNSYKSSVILAPQGESQSSSMGGLSSLAGLAGVSLGGGNGKDPFTMMETVLKDYEFNAYVIKKYNLSQKLNNPENLVFALGIDSLYSKSEINKEKSEEDTIYDSYKTLMGILSISSDKKSSLISLSAEYIDRFLVKELVDIYLKEMIEKIKIKDMKEIEKQILYYQKELSSTYDVSLKEQLSKSISELMQKKVFSQANDYYFVSKIVDSRVAHIKEKSKPKRALILVVSFVTSIILGIFLVFFMEFIKGNKKDEKKI